METKKTFDYKMFLGIVLVASLLRAPIAAVGPLISSIRESLPFSSGALGLLSTIPVVLFAIGSPVVPIIGAKIGAGRALQLGVVIIALGIVLRSYAGVFGLFFGTVLLGFGISVGNVLIPGVIKGRFPDHIRFATGAFSVSMGVFASVSTALSYPISQTGAFGWRNSLAVWGVLAIFGFLAWWPQRGLVLQPVRATQAEPTETEKPVLRSSMAWWITLLMGAQSCLFYLFASWMPTLMQDKGFSPEVAGYLTFSFHLVTLPAAFIIPALSARMKNQRALITAVAALYVVSVSTLFLSGSIWTAAFGAMFSGFSTAACFNLCMLFISLRTRSAARATRLSGMVQSIGYTIGAAGPLLAGVLLDQTGNWNAAFLLALVLVAVVFVAGRRASENRLV